MNPDDRERKRLWQQNYNASNREKVAVSNARWRANNQDKIKSYYERTKAARRQTALRRLNSLAGYAKHMVSAAKVRAAKIGVPFDLTAADIHFPKRCPLLGVELNYVLGAKGGPKFDSPSLDRLDPAAGYVRGNVFVMSMRANRLKSDATIEELRAILAYMETFQ